MTLQVGVVVDLGRDPAAAASELMRTKIVLRDTTKAVAEGHDQGQVTGITREATEAETEVATEIVEETPGLETGLTDREEIEMAEVLEMIEVVAVTDHMATTAETEVVMTSMLEREIAHQGTEETEIEVPLMATAERKTLPRK